MGDVLLIATTSKSSIEKRLIRKQESQVVDSKSANWLHDKLSIFSCKVDNFWSTQDIKIAPSGHVNWSLLNMLAKYFSIIWNYALSVFSQRKYNFYYQSTLLDAFWTNSHKIFGRNPSMAIPLLANQDLTPILSQPMFLNCLLNP